MGCPQQHWQGAKKSLWWGGKAKGTPADKTRHACSSQYLSKPTKITTNTETATLSTSTADCFSHPLTCPLAKRPHPLSFALVPQIWSFRMYATTQSPMQATWRWLTIIHTLHTAASLPELSIPIRMPPLGGQSRLQRFPSTAPFLIRGPAE